MIKTGPGLTTYFISSVSSSSEASFMACSASNSGSELSIILRRALRGRRPNRSTGARDNQRYLLGGGRRRKPPPTVAVGGRR
jgi:hypothetical protein